MDITITIYQCDMEDEKNIAIIENMKKDLHTIDDINEDSYMIDGNEYSFEVNFYERFKKRKAYRILKIADNTRKQFDKLKDDVCVFARINF